MYSFKFSHAAGLVDPNCMLTRGLVDPNSMRFNSLLSGGSRVAFVYETRNGLRE